MVSLAGTILDPCKCNEMCSYLQQVRILLDKVLLQNHFLVTDFIIHLPQYHPLTSSYVSSVLIATTYSLTCVFPHVSPICGALHTTPASAA